MSRRALKPISPDLDLSGYALEWDELPVPLCGEALFGRQAPLEVEVGSGKGLFLAAAAAADLASNFLGIEIAAKYARFAAARLAKRVLGNARVLHGDAMRLFRDLVPPDSLQAVHVYFPDPWWKARHKKRRIMNPTFVRLVERTLIPGGTLHFWTDVAEYFLSGVATVQQATRLAGPFEVPERPADHDLDYRTHFERRMRLHGLPVYRALFRKAD